MNFNKVFNGLFLSLILVFVFACKKETSSIGLPNQTENLPLSVLYTDTITVKAATALVSNNISSLNIKYGSGQYVYVGQLYDNYSGRIAAKAFTGLRWSPENLESSGATIDSVYFYFDITEINGLASAAQTFELFQLESAIDVNASKYPIDAGPNVKPTSLGNVSFVPSRNTYAIKVTDANFIAALATASKSNSILLDGLKGLALIQTNSIDGLVCKINLASENTRLIMYTTLPGDVKKNFTLRMDNVNYFTNMVNDKSAASVATLVNDYDIITSASLNDYSVLQGLIGFKTVITFPYLNAIKDTFGEVHISRAILDIPVANSFVTDAYQVPDSLFLNMVTNDGYYQKRTDGTDMTLGGDFDNQYTHSNTQYVPNIDGVYRFKMSSYIQGLFYDTYPNNGLFVNSSQSISSLNRLVIPNKLNSEERIKLRLYFSNSK